MILHCLAWAWWKNFNTMEQEIKNMLQSMMDLEPTEKYSVEELTAMLAIHINKLLQSNFEKLVNLLYRIDVSEKKLKQLLKDHPKEDAGNIIASLIIERQLEKIKSRKQFKTDDSFDGEEKW
jgi:hypothetical protein